jgi:cyclophilin family peptidyl-prolyl cis-trans isomerase
MKLLGRAVLLVALLVCGAGPALALDPENALYLDLAFGRVVISLQPDVAPKTCAQIKKLVRAGFYNGLTFHRVIDGFMAQTGDPTGTGTGGSGHPLKAEFSQEPFVRGVVAMARTSDPNSADSQFFIMYAAAPGLDGKYTIFGHVESGMEFVDKIKKGDKVNNGMVVNPDKIVKMQVVADVIADEDNAKKPKEKKDDNTDK